LQAVAEHVPDTIQRELILPAPPERVWAALTQADQLAAWFGTQAAIDLRPGGAITFIWDGSTGPVGNNSGVVEIVEPPRRFVFRWQSFAADVPSTRVEFTLEPHSEGTLLRLVESGFASLPPHMRIDCHERNTEGWQRELAELARYLTR
jgi:uncharacterized protein YndB with AHSA1/START domain